MSFGCIVAGRALQTNLQQLTADKFKFDIEDAVSVNHFVVFVTAALPDGVGVAVYCAFSDADWSFLGFLNKSVE